MLVNISLSPPPPFTKRQFRKILRHCLINQICERAQKRNEDFDITKKENNLKITPACLKNFVDIGNYGQYLSQGKKYIA